MGRLVPGWLSAVLALGMLLVPAAPAAAFDAALYGEILQRYTVEVPDLAGVRVDYAALRTAPAWSRLVRDLSRNDPAALAGRVPRIAFWINAYNILAIDLVVRHQPAHSIRDLGSVLRPVWDRPAGRVGGREVSLGEIEHRILRPLGEPRIHAALVCASLSCPALRREPYEPARLDAQLDDALRTWLADPRKGARIDRDSDRLLVSRVFLWFVEDFDASGGVLAFLHAYWPPEIRRWLDARPTPPVLGALPYDWSLNDLGQRGAARARLQ